MDDARVEELVTEAQRLQLAEWERDLALARVRAFVHQHRHELSLSEAQRLTLLPSDDLRKLLTP